jgi:nickel-dependent lactate racemase
VKVARDLYEVEIDHPAELLSGVSYPKSRDLYQASRGANVVVFGPRPVVFKGGVILIPASCEDGCGHPGYCDIMKKAEDVDDIIAISREEGFAAGEQKALILAWILKQARMVMTDCTLPEETLKELHLESMPTLQEAFDRELRRNPKARVTLIPDGLLTLPILEIPDNLFLSPAPFLFLDFNKVGNLLRMSELTKNLNVREHSMAVTVRFLSAFQDLTQSKNSSL